MPIACNGCRGPKDPAHAAPSYRRALLLVAALNLGMGLAEGLVGFLGRSQALKADALDFLGDGLITGLGLLALAHGPRWRARGALLQGLFLAVLGLAVLAGTLFRIGRDAHPEASAMTALGLAALATNIAAAALLLPHREGDANVRAVWLFSRNDALGNIAVIAGGGLVAWTRSPWPDLIVAAAIASLFLVGAASIIRTASRELAATPPAPPPPAR